jgi:hypothetical protein
MARARAIATRKLTGELLRVGFKADAFQEAHGLGRRFFRAAPEHLDLAEIDVVHHLHVGEQLEALEYHPDHGAQAGQVGLGRADRLAVDDDLPGLERLEPVHALDQCRLAGAGRAAHHDHFALFHLGGAVLQDLEGAVVLADVLEFDHCHCWLPFGRQPQATSCKLQAVNSATVRRA